GHWDSPGGPVKPLTYAQRAQELKRKELHRQRHSDDSIVYTQSKGSQASAMRPTKRRGESF
ncbi:LIM domain-binding protein 3, partial [Biomphalaria glabrata]